MSFRIMNAEFFAVFWERFTLLALTQQGSISRKGSPALFWWDELARQAFA
jgi:hypothetical protein